MRHKKDGSTLATCNYNELLRFEYDHVSWMGWTLSVEHPNVIIYGHANDGPTLEIHRSVFNRLVKGYIKARVFVRHPRKPAASRGENTMNWKPRKPERRKHRKMRVKCGECKGNGFHIMWSPDISQYCKACPRCNGKGTVEQ